MTYVLTILTIISIYSCVTTASFQTSPWTPFTRIHQTNSPSSLRRDVKVITLSTVPEQNQHVGDDLLHDSYLSSWGESMDRRKLLHSITGSISSLAFILQQPSKAAAKEASPVVFNEKQKQSLLSAEEVADRLRKIPTFTLVDKRGVPFTVVGEDARVTAYFFTTYNEADRILDLATKSADKFRSEAIQELNVKRKKEGKSSLDLDSGEEEKKIGVNPWRNARISTVPLDFAVTLATRSEKGLYFQVAPAEEDVEDALAVDKISDLADGKVPLFYIEDLELKNKTIPLYFRKSELLQEWKRQNPITKDTTPDIKVTELFSVLKEMVKPGGTDEELKNLVFIPPVESEKKAKECLRRGGDEVPFKLGERIVVL